MPLKNNDKTPEDYRSNTEHDVVDRVENKRESTDVRRSVRGSFRDYDLADFLSNSGAYQDFVRFGRGSDGY